MKLMASAEDMCRNMFVMMADVKRKNMFPTRGDGMLQKVANSEWVHLKFSSRACVILGSRICLQSSLR